MGVVVSRAIYCLEHVYSGSSPAVAVVGKCLNAMYHVHLYQLETS